MKNFFMALAFVLSSASMVQAVESKEYCDRKCSPEHCSTFIARVALCKADCPDHFPKCYSAVPADAKKSVDEVIAKLPK